MSTAPVRVVLAKALGVLLLGLVASPALALEFRSTGSPAILYDGPSKASYKLLAAGIGVPLEIIVETAGWSKVRTPTGRLAWIETTALGSLRTLMVRADSGEIRREPRADSPVVLTAARGVVLAIEEKSGPPGWRAVRHATGQSGWIRSDEVWGE